MEITSGYMSYRGLGGRARRSALQGRWRVLGLWARLDLLGARLDLLGVRLALLGEPGGTGELLGGWREPLRELLGEPELVLAPLASLLGEETNTSGLSV